MNHRCFPRRFRATTDWRETKSAVALNLRGKPCVHGPKARQILAWRLSMNLKTLALEMNDLGKTGSWVQSASKSWRSRLSMNHRCFPPQIQGYRRLAGNEICG